MTTKLLSTLNAQTNSTRCSHGNTKHIMQRIGNSSNHNLGEAIPVNPNPRIQSPPEKFGDDLETDQAFKAACGRVDDKNLWVVHLLAGYSHAEKITAQPYAFTSEKLVTQLISAPTSRFIQFLGEYVVHHCVNIWHTRKVNLVVFFICGEINEGYAWNQMLYNLGSFVRRHGKRTAASLLRRKQFAKCKDALDLSQATKLAMEWALDIVRNINNRVSKYVFHGGKSLLHCVLENTQFEYIDRKETAFLIAYTLYNNLVLMRNLQNRSSSNSSPAGGSSGTSNNNDADDTSQSSGNLTNGKGRSVVNDDPAEDTNKCTYPGCQPRDDVRTCLLCETKYHHDCKGEFEQKEVSDRTKLPPDIWCVCYQCHPSQNDDIAKCAELDRCILNWSGKLKALLRFPRSNAAEALHQVVTAWADYMSRLMNFVIPPLECNESPTDADVNKICKDIREQLKTSLHFLLDMGRSTRVESMFNAMLQGFVDGRFADVEDVEEMATTKKRKQDSQASMQQLSPRHPRSV